MHAHQLRGLGVANVELKINDAFSADAKVAGHQVGKSREVFFVDFEFVFRNGFNSAFEQIFNHGHRDNWLHLGLLLDGDLFSRQMDRQVGELQKRPFGVPVSAFEFLADLDDHLACNGKISVEPRSPEPPAVEHHIQLVVAASLELAVRRDLEYGRVRVAAHNLVGARRFLAAFGPSEERADGRVVAREVVSLSACERPLFGLLQLNKPVFFQLGLTIVDRVEVGGRGIERVNDLERVCFADLEELLGDRVLIRNHINIKNHLRRRRPPPCRLI